MENVITGGKKSNHKLKAQISMHTMMIPAILFAIVFFLFPLVGLVMAFQDYSPSKGFFKSQFVDIYNFTKLFNGKCGINSAAVRSPYSPL